MTFMPYNTTPDDDIPDDIPDPDDAISLGADPGLLITAVPALLGFRPRASLVLVGMRDEAGARRVGPVVRVDLDDAALRQGINALGRAMVGSKDPTVVAIVIDPASWPVRGHVDDLLVTANRRLGRRGIPVTETLVIDAVEAGRRWRVVERHGPDGRWWTLHQGTLGAARDNPVRGALKQGEFDGSLSAGEFARLLEPDDPAPRSAPGLPECWRTGVASSVGDWEAGARGTGHERTGSAAASISALLLDVAAVVDPGQGDDSSPEDFPAGCGADLEIARSEMRRRLADPTLAQAVFDMCMSPELFPGLVVLALGTGSLAVEALLLEIVSLAGPVLRRRALALIAVLGMCGRNGALGLQAARLCLASRDSGDGSDPDDIGGLEEPGEITAAEFLSLVVAEATSGSIAEAIVTGMCDGSAAPLVLEILEKGARHLEDGLAGEPQVAGVLDLAAVSAVRTALARRAAT